MPIRSDPHRKKSTVIFWWETAVQSCPRCFPESLLLCPSHQAREILWSIMLIYGPCSSPSYYINIIQKQNEQCLSTRSKPWQFARKFFPHEFPLLPLVFHSETQSMGLINPSPALLLRDCLLLSEGFVWVLPPHPHNSWGHLLEVRIQELRRMVTWELSASGASEEKMLVEEDIEELALGEDSMAGKTLAALQK